MTRTDLQRRASGMMQPVQGASRIAAGIAAALPIAFAVGAVFVLLVVAGGPAGVARMIDEAGGSAWIVLFVSGLATIGSAVLLLLSGLGLRVPAALVVGVPALPWAAGILGMALAMANVNEAIALADPSSRAALMAAGVAESANARLLGAVFGGALLAAVGIGLGTAALGQRAPRNVGLGAALGLCGGLILVAAAVVTSALAEVGVGAMLVVLPALAALAALGLAGAAAGPDVPYGRSAALAAAAPVAAGLGFVAGAVAASTGASIAIFSALAGVDPQDRARIVAVAAREVAPVAALERWGGVVGLVPVAILAAWTALRARPSGGRILGAVAVVLVAIATLGLDAMGIDSAREDLERAAALPWRDDPGFEPVSIRGDSGGGDCDAVVTLEAVRSRSGEPVPLASPDGPARLTALFAQILRSPRGEGLAAPELELPPEIAEAEGGTGTRSLGEEGTMGGMQKQSSGRYSIRGPTDNPGPFLAREEAASSGILGLLGGLGPDAGALVGRPETPTLTLAIDGRLPATLLRSVLFAVQNAGARSVRIVGVPAAVGDRPSGEDESPSLPLLAPFAFQARSRLVLLEAWLPDAFADDDPRLLHATVTGPGPLVLTRRAGAGESIPVPPRGPSPAERADLGPLESGPRIAYLALGPAATAASFLDAADRVSDLGLWPLAVLSPETPGHPERPPAPAPEQLATGGIGWGSGTGEGTIGLGNIGSIGQGFGTSVGRPAGVTRIRQGSAEVQGSLSSEIVRRVVRQHLNEIRFCYEMALNSNPDLAGRVSVRFVISPMGGVAQSNVAASTLGNEQVESCMVRAVRRWTFPSPEGGGIVVVTYPFLLEAQ